MRDHAELVTGLRHRAEYLITWDREQAPPGITIRNTDAELMREAADVIEELRKPDWIKVESRQMTEEERKEWSEHIVFDIEDEDAIIYTSKLPDDGQEVLVCNKWGRVWIDTFSDDPDYGVGFEENGDMDGIVAWQPKPKPYETAKEE